jgi:hypothetical protein
VQDDELSDFRGCRDEKIRKRGRSMLASFGKRELHLQSPLLNCGSEVFNQKRGHRCRAQILAQLRGGSSGVPDLETRNRTDGNHSATDPLGPLLTIRAKA